ncbi:MAG: hypothetical protein II180_04445 [Proteobacteria bacterium]|nr:hypothetical protein [Pseudomonadota bacterium]
MLSWCLNVGIVLIAIAAILTFVYFGIENQTPKVSKRGISAGNKRKRVSDAMLPVSYYESDEICLNMDAFADPELSGSDTSLEAQNRLFDMEAFEREDEEIEKILEEPSSGIPQLTLASLLEVQRYEAMQTDGVERPETNVAKPRIIGDSACALGIRYFEYLLEHHAVPRGAKQLTSEANILVAENALKTSRQSATLSHGGVAQRIGERAVCLFEPLESAVGNVEKAVVQLREVFENKTIFIVLAKTEDVPGEMLAHLSAVCKAFKIPKNSIYIEQPDGSFYNYIEDTHNYVPDRLNVMGLTQDFFGELLDYAHSAYDDGDHEAVLRTLWPLLDPLYNRVYVANDFPKVLLAQAFNLMGMTERNISQDIEAIRCFEISLQLLLEIMDYEAIKSVMANLGITLALSHPVTLPKIERAIRCLEDVTRLNPRDDEAWQYLANSYLEEYRLKNAPSLLKRALRAYDKAYELAPSEEIASCRDALERQIGGARRASMYKPAEDNAVVPILTGEANRMCGRAE